MEKIIFNDYSKYYDIIYKDKDYSAEAKYIEKLLLKNEKKIKTILEFGSGTGKHGSLLSERGYEVLGIEKSERMVALAPKIPHFLSKLADICNLHLNRKFDAVLALFHVISYQISNKEILSVFKNASEHLEVGGLFIFDFWYSPAVYEQRAEVKVKHIKDKYLEITRISEPFSHSNENRVDIKFTIYARDIKNNTNEIVSELHTMRHFSLPEIDFLAQMSNFERVVTEEFLTGKPASQNTWGVCVILKKITNE